MKTKITSALRQVWRWSPYPREAKLKARIAYGKYLCAKCQKIFHEKDIRVDHIETVVPINWTASAYDWSVYIERLFCPVEKLQILCTKDHDEKTKEERRLRTSNKLNAKLHLDDISAH